MLSAIKKFWKSAIYDPTSGNIAAVTGDRQLSAISAIYDPTSGNIAKVNDDRQLHVVLQAVIDPNNAYDSLLGIGAVYDGTATDVLNYSGIGINVAADQDSAVKGLAILFSKDNITWFGGEEYTVIAGSQKFFTPPRQAKWFKIEYTNGGVAANVDLFVILSKSPFKWSSHNISDTITDEDDSELITNVNKAKSDLTGHFENITSYRAALNVNPAFVHRKIVNETFHQHTGTTTTPSVAVSEGATSITFTSVAGFAIGSFIKLEEGPIQEVGILTVTNIVGAVVTLDRPISNDYTTAALITEVNTNMAVAGTLASPQIFEIDPPDGVVWQLTRLLHSITASTVMDDAKFGGIAALTNGVSLRACTAAGRTVVYANWKSNYDQKLDMFDVTYSSKAPAGSYGLNGRWTFTNAEVIVELDGDASPVQSLQVLIQDDLTGLDTFFMRCQGRVFSP